MACGTVFSSNGAEPDAPPAGGGAAIARALFPAKAAARVWRGPIEDAVDEVLSAPEIARLVDRALSGSLPEDALVRNRVLERIAAELAASGELERLMMAALASPANTRAHPQGAGERRNTTRSAPRRIEP